MSGPTTAILVADPIEVLLSAAAIRAAQAIQQGYQVSAELAAQHQIEAEKIVEQQRNAGQLRQQSLHQLLDSTESEFSQLLSLAERLDVAEKIKAGRPLDDHDMEDKSPYLRAIQTYNSDIKAILLNKAATVFDHDTWEALPKFDTIEQNSVALSTTDRLLDRIKHLGTPPKPIAQLVLQLSESLPPQREHLLQQELRRQIQLHLESVQQRAVDEASALILRQSLKELGYQVQTFSDTLFVEGGVVHFRRHAWGDYMVRMRINEKTHTANFNVIRATQDGNNERSVLDHLAEDRWCAEFPTLLKAMEARGLGLTVTRRLEAGEVPVQLVDSQQLPQFSDEEQRRSDSTLKAKEIK